MTVLIIDAPEVLQRSLGNTLEAERCSYRMVPDRRTEAATHPSGAPAADDMLVTAEDIAAAAGEVDCALWFAADAGKPEHRAYGIAVAEALAQAGVSRVVAIMPLRASRQPDQSTMLRPLFARSALFHGGVTMVTTSPMYGPGDELVSRLLIMMRSLPVVPLLANGKRQYQPLWHEDLAHALVAAARGGDTVGGRCRLAGPEVVTQRSLYDRIAPLIDRHPAVVPIPEFATGLGLAIIDAASGSDSATHDAVWAVDADTIILTPAENDLERLLGRAPTTIGAGLRRLLTELPEQLPSTGVGTLQIKHFWTDLRDTSLAPGDVVRLVRTRFADIMPVPVGVEPAAPATQLDVDSAVTIHLPGRGHVQVRVEAADEAHVVLSTLRGHTLAGVVRFLAVRVPDGVRFEVMTADKAATPIDWLTLSLGGTRLQDANWRTVVERVATMVGVRDAEVHSEVRNASEAETQHLSTWVRRLVDERVSGEASLTIRPPIASRRDDG